VPVSSFPLQDSEMRRLLGATEWAGEPETPPSLSLYVVRCCWRSSGTRRALDGANNGLFTCKHWKWTSAQSELSKTEQRLRDRTAVLSRLRQHHEELLNVNGQLQYALPERKSLLITLP